MFDTASEMTAAGHCPQLREYKVHPKRFPRRKKMSLVQNGRDPTDPLRDPFPPNS